MQDLTWWGPNDLENGEEAVQNHMGELVNDLWKSGTAVINVYLVTHRIMDLDPALLKKYSCLNQHMSSQKPLWQSRGGLVEGSVVRWDQNRFCWCKCHSMHWKICFVRLTQLNSVNLSHPFFVCVEFFFTFFVLSQHKFQLGRMLSSISSTPFQLRSRG